MRDLKPSESVPPVYEKLKDLHLDTHLALNGHPHAVLVAPADGIYDAPAAHIQEAIEQRTGVRIPVVNDHAPEAQIPMRRNVIALGNRSTNRMIEELYNRYFTLLDLWYPGPGGYDVRSLHNPFGGGRNAILIGGSDSVGVERAVEVFLEKLEKAEGGRGTLSLGWLMEIGLGEGMAAPKDLKDFQIWEASVGSRSTGYFGWNSLSKHMAMYYMRGDAFHAREVIRLAFPDARAKQELAELDEELIENKDDPLAGPYHYGAHMMILFWDLIEESPAFTDEERLRVTNAFSRQFAHPQEQSWRKSIPDEIPKGNAAYAQPASRVGSRHEQWSAIALYCLGRYFERDYGDPLWTQCVASATWRYSSLHHHAWVTGEIDNLAWYSSANASILQYMLLTGDRKPLENGVLARILRGQEILFSGREREPMLNSSAISFWRQAAYLMQDGRYLEYLHRTRMDLGVFRLGQSWTPEPHLEPALPHDLVGTWRMQPMPEPMWRERKSGIPLEKSFLVGSFRSAPDASGDFLLIKGWNGAGRNPYHTFAILELRLAGQTVLAGYLNQIITRADGKVEPRVAMDAALAHCDVVGQAAVAVGETPDAPYSNWRRTIIQRLGWYALIVDRLAFRASSENMEVEILWQGAESAEDRGDRQDAPGEKPLKREWRAFGPGGIRAENGGEAFGLVLSDPVETSAEKNRARMAWRGAVKKGARRFFFSLIAGVAGKAPVCARLSENAAALALPAPGIAVAGQWEGIEGDLVVLAKDHLHGMGCKRVSLDADLLSADRPVDVDWDFEQGALHIVTRKKTRVKVKAHCQKATVQSDSSRPIANPESGDGTMILDLPEGRHCIEEVRPDPVARKKLTERLEALLAEAQKNREGQEAEHGRKPSVQAPPPSTVMEADVGGGLVDLVAAPSAQGALIFAAEEQAVHVLREDGKEVRRMTADGPIRMLRLWEEHGLLLAGCADEKVIAFDAETGKRRWTFVSQMNPAVFQAAKQYWFKSAPGHEGIHGLHTGVFLDGKTQAFVGSACTLEILDENGKSIHRLPVFWGPGVGFGLIGGPEGSTNLLIARAPTDMHTLAVVNNRNLDATPRGFYGVPEGHTNISAWGCMHRRHIFVADLDGDGKQEVTGEIDGTWNRIGVWASDGRPLYNVHLGPGEFEPPPRPCPRRNVRDMDVADVDGDGKKEIIAGLAGGLALLLNHRCEKIWSKRLPAPPAVLACVKSPQPWIAVGCEDGTLIAMDGMGKTLCAGQAHGRPTCITVLGDMALIGTHSGKILGWRSGII